MKMNNSEHLRENASKSDILKTDHLTLPVANILEGLSETNSLKNKVLNAFKQSVQKEDQAMLQNIDIFQKLALFAQNQPVNLEGLKVDVSDVVSMNDTILELLQPLSSANLYRNAEISRIRENIVEEYKRKVKCQKVEDKTELSHLLKDANRCILAENRARLKHNKTIMSIYPQNPPSGNMPKGSFSQRESFSCSSKELQWKESMQKAKWEESNKLKTKAINEVCLKLHQINQNRCKDLYQLLETYFGIELFYHSKALEQFTSAYQILAKWKNSPKIDRENDISAEDPSSMAGNNSELLTREKVDLETTPVLLTKDMKPLNEQSDNNSLDLDEVLRGLQDSASVISPR